VEKKRASSSALRCQFPKQTSSSLCRVERRIYRPRINTAVPLAVSLPSHSFSRLFASSSAVSNPFRPLQNVVRHRCELGANSNEYGTRVGAGTDVSMARSPRSGSRNREGELTMPLSLYWHSPSVTPLVLEGMLRGIDKSSVLGRTSLGDAIGVVNGVFACCLWCSTSYVRKHERLVRFRLGSGVGKPSARARTLFPTLPPPRKTPEKRRRGIKTTSKLPKRKPR